MHLLLINVINVIYRYYNKSTQVHNWRLSDSCRSHYHLENSCVQLQKNFCFS